MMKSGFGNTSFRKVLKIQMWVGALIIFVGLKCFLLVLLNQVGTLESITSNFGIHLVNLSFMEGFYTGFGCALMGAGIALIARNLRLIKNEEKYKRAEIGFLDERNRFIKSATLSTTSSIFIVGLAFAIVVAGMFNSVVFVTLLGTFFSLLVLLVGTYLLVKSKY